MFEKLHILMVYSWIESFGSIGLCGASIVLVYVLWTVGNNINNKVLL